MRWTKCIRCISPAPPPEVALVEGQITAFAWLLHAEGALAVACGSRAGILRYSEAEVPHFISFIRAGEVFRFFNVNDGLEDFVSSMEMFFASHVKPPKYVSVFTLE